MYKLSSVRLGKETDTNIAGEYSVNIILDISIVSGIQYGDGFSREILVTSNK